jgi:RNA-directed DNA polymerase
MQVANPFPHLIRAIGAIELKKPHFKTQGPRNWFFAATEKQEDGADAQITLRKESDTPIQRHVKILADANPHDRNWGPYFEAR